jgi:hypothetical protein
MTLRSITELAREWGCPPRALSDAFYSRHLDEGRIILVGGRRLIPSDYVAEVRAKLTELGKLPQLEASAR